jgi:hypothetical protein
MANENPSPKHGSTSEPQEASKKPPKSVSQPDGTAANDPKGETQAQPSGSDGQNPATAGKTNAPVNSQTTERRHGAINPSAPTQGTEGGNNELSKQFTSEGPPTMDSAGETGTRSGKGTLEVDEQNISADRSARKDSGVEREFAGKDDDKAREDDRGAETDIEGAA